MTAEATEVHLLDVASGELVTAELWDAISFWECPTPRAGARERSFGGPTGTPCAVLPFPDDEVLPPLVPNRGGLAAFRDHLAVRSP